MGYLLPPGKGHSAEKALTGWEVSIAVTLAGGVVLFFIGRNEKDAAILRRDAIGTVAIGWLVCSAFSALPYLFCAPRLSVPESLFESISGLTTTGASVFGDLSVLPETIFLWRSLTQWIGGMGILAMFVLVLSSLGANGRSLYLTESSAHMKDLTGAQIRKTVRSLWSLYFVLTILCALGLWSAGMTLFQSVNHAMTTVSTGGFGTEADSINGFGVGVRIWMIAFMLICGVSFPLYLALIRRGRSWANLRRHEETWVFLAIVVIASIALIADRTMARDSSASGVTGCIETVFNAVSIATTTGYVVGDYDGWPALAKGLILFLMVVGGCSGSTAGGLKVSRLILWLKTLRIEIRRAYRPNEQMKLLLNGRSVPEGTRGQLSVVIVSAAAAIAVGSYILVGLEPEMSVDGCVSAVISCVSNIGPAFNEFGPTDDFASLSSSSMVLLSFLMILGRLEFIAVLVLFSRTLWRKY